MATIFPQTLENRAALRTALSTVVAVLLAFTLHLDRPYWAGMTVVILANVYTGNVIDKAIMRIVGTIIGAWVGYFIAGFINNSLFLYLLVSFLIIAVSVYYYNFSRYAYAYLLAALAAFIVISETAVDVDAAFLVAIWRPIDIGLGVLVSAAAAYCLFPNTVKDSMEKQTAIIFADVDALLTKTALLLQKNNADLLQEIRTDNLALKRKLRKAIEMLAFMRREIGTSHYKMDQFRLLLDSCFSLCRLLSFYMASEKLPGVDPEGHFSAIFKAFHQDLTQLHALFTEKKSSASLQHTLALQHIDEQLDTIPVDHLSAVHFVRQIGKILTTLLNVLNGSSSTKKKKKLSVSHQQQLSQDSDVIKHSIKAGLAATLALVFWLISNWPGGLNGIISSIVISIRRNLFEMKNISLHRVLGCTIGGGLALFTLSLFSMNLYDLLLIIFLGVWAFSYFSFTQTTYAYIGLQANIALVIALAQAGGPPTVLSPVLERLGGVMIGIGTSFMVANALWRTDLWHMLARQMNKLKQYLAHNVFYILSDEPKGLYELSNSFWVTRGILETFDAQHLNLEKQQALAKEHEDYEKLVIIQATLNHIQEGIDVPQATAAITKANIDIKKYVGEIAANYSSQNRNSQPTLDWHAAVKTIKQAGRLSRSERENSVAYLYALSQLAEMTPFCKPQNKALTSPDECHHPEQSERFLQP